MILDSLDHAHHYHNLNRRIAMALEFLRRPATASLEPTGFGSDQSLRVLIEGDDEVFALVQRYRTKPLEHAFWEAHRRYIDVQYVVEGAEVMGHADLNIMRVEREYDPAKDFTKLLPPLQHEQDDPQSARVNFVRVSAGMFTIFMPHDAHAPSLAVNDSPAEVKKIVVKVKV